MSNLLFGIAGAAIGSAFGMPALGFALGSGVGAALGSHHHAAPPAWPGARLTDLKVQTSTYGIGIPRVYGVCRLAGNVLWAADIMEVKDPSGHYAYYGNFALGLCAGPIVGIRRIWADGKEIFKMDLQASESLRAHYPQNLRFYLGDEQQQADPLLEAHQGKGQVPAFRGLAYVVFERFPLANFNNRLPTLQVEIVQSAVAVPDTEESSSQEETREQDGIRYTVKRHYQHKPKPSGKKWISAAVPLTLIIHDLCSQAGWPPDQIDTAALETMSVRGFVLSQPISVREALALLQQAYAFDVVESGRQLQCSPRGVKVPLFISEEAWVREEGADSAQGVLTRLPDLEGPEQVVVFFTEADKDYRLATQTARRLNATGHASERLELPLVLTLDEAAQIAERILADHWQSREQVSFSLSRAYAVLDPSDRIILHHRIWRVICTEYGSPGLIKIQAMGEALCRECE